MTKHQKILGMLDFDDDVFDRMDDAYWEEHDRWCVRRKLDKSGYELVRNSTPKGQIQVNSEEYQQITNLTKRDLADSQLSQSDRATSWLNVYRGRASMKAALGAA